MNSQFSERAIVGLTVTGNITDLVHRAQLLTDLREHIFKGSRQRIKIGGSAQACNVPYHALTVFIPRSKLAARFLRIPDAVNHRVCILAASTTLTKSCSLEFSSPSLKTTRARRRSPAVLSFAP